ncbi:MAG: S-methyl-5-thioribose-1-phosphate isomerase [Balneolaceae bacterium]
MNQYSSVFQSIRWQQSKLRIIDQTELPEKETYLELETAGEVWDTIKQLKVRGAPAIGIAGAYGFYLGIKDSISEEFDSFFNECQEVAHYLNSSRPTAVNLDWALKKILSGIYTHRHDSIDNIKHHALQMAISIHEEDRKLCRLIGEHGATLVPENARILTHCNTGGLATAEFGTAFSVILHAHQAGKLKNVWVDETRPLLQGARLTAWELQKAGIPFTLNIDSAAAFLMQKGWVDLVITGADRITLNGDAANKIGTYSLAVLAKAHNIPFYIAAPYSTIDMNLSSGDKIIIEERHPDEVTTFGNHRRAPDDISVYNPAFDVTPNHLISAIITEKGVIKPDYSKNFETLFK